MCDQLHAQSVVEAQETGSTRNDVENSDQATTGEELDRVMRELKTVGVQQSWSRRNLFKRRSS